MTPQGIVVSVFSSLLLVTIDLHGRCGNLSADVHFGPVILKVDQVLWSFPEKWSQLCVWANGNVIRYFLDLFKLQFSFKRKEIRLRLKPAYATFRFKYKSSSDSFTYCEAKTIAKAKAMLCSPYSSTGFDINPLFIVAPLLNYSTTYLICLSGETQCSQPFLVKILTM